MPKESTVVPNKPETLRYIRELVRERAAIVLEADKEYLVRSRLDPVAKAAGVKSLEELVAKLQRSSYCELHKKVVEAMTTNETSFFRDGHPFEMLKTIVIPDLMEKRRRHKCLHIWCGASSSGQEPYTIMMVLREYFPELAQWTVNFLATDISAVMVQRCREGRYSQLEVNRGVPTTFLSKYFQKQDLHWQVREDLRLDIEFREMNLVGTWPLLCQMDLIFLRNVLIYFDVDTKKKILTKVRQVMKPDGYLVLGGTETTLNLDEAFQRRDFGGTSCYQLQPGI